MNILIISDEENKIISSQFVKNDFCDIFDKNSIKAELMEIGKDEIAPCIGCFGCWIKTPGECVIKDKMAEINKKIIGSDVVIFVTPIIFGQYSYSMKNVIDRTLCRNLPFFKKINGRTRHPARYEKYPIQYVIGCIDKNQEEDKKIFLDTHRKYRSNVKKVYIAINKEEMISAVQNIAMEVAGNEED